MNKQKFVSVLLAAAIALAGGAAMAAGDAGKGKKVFNKCKPCHSTKASVNKVGPSLAGVFGRKAGTENKYKLFKGLKGAEWSWDEATLMEYLANPGKFTKARTGKKSSMILKLKKKKDRENVIEYLKTLK